MTTTTVETKKAPSTRAVFNTLATADLTKFNTDDLLKLKDRAKAFQDAIAYECEVRAKRLTGG